MHKFSLILILALALLAGTATAQSTLKPGHPDRYVVQTGDTLWELASRFLRDPWRWSSIWKSNPQIKNPRLIYPGDLLVVTSGSLLKVIRRKPQTRRQQLTTAIPTIAPHVIQPFLDSSLIVEQNELETAGHVVVGVNDELILGKYQQFYARKLVDQSAQEYKLLRIGKSLISPDNEELLGIEAIHLGDAVMIRRDPIAKLQITDSVREIVPGDRLVATDARLPLPYYQPHSTSTSISAWIIHAPSGVRDVGRYDAVILSAGKREGIEPGHVFKAMTNRGTRKDPVDGDSYQLPIEEAGIMMVFRVFDKVSYALILQATREIGVGDRVVSP